MSITWVTCDHGMAGPQVTKCQKGPRTWADSLDKRPMLMKMDMRFGMWNVINLYRGGSIMTLGKEL
jgi:hypothetical protein